jgi:hypothetical protein
MSTAPPAGEGPPKPPFEGDRRDAAWYTDKVVAALVFLGGISAIVFIISIFVFIRSRWAWPSTSPSSLAAGPARS